jgi:hypothetical protein
MSLDFTDHTRGHLINVKTQVNDFLDSRMEYYYDKFVIPEVKAVARAANLPEAFVESFEFRKTGRNKGKVVNTLGTKDEPLAKWFNYGTKRNYPIEPKVKHPEGTERAARDADEVGDGQVQHPTVLHWIDPNTGEDRFASIVIHPGFPKTEAMEIGVRLGMKTLIPEVKKDVKDRFGDSDA